MDSVTLTRLDPAPDWLVRGHITFTPHDTGRTRTAIVVRVLAMSGADPHRIQTCHGAAGPAQGLL